MDINNIQEGESQKRMRTPELVLDPAIRDWVVLPMFLMVVLVGLGRHYVQTLIKSSPKITEDGLDEIR
jgi:ER membrane protein complex subunit 3